MIKSEACCLGEAVWLVSCWNPPFSTIRYCGYRYGRPCLASFHECWRFECRSSCLCIKLSELSPHPKKPTWLVGCLIPAQFSVVLSNIFFYMLKNECDTMSVCMSCLNKHSYRRVCAVNKDQSPFWRCRWSTFIPPVRLALLCLLEPLTAFETASVGITH